MLGSSQEKLGGPFDTYENNAPWLVKIIKWLGTSNQSAIF